MVGIAGPKSSSTVTITAVLMSMVGRPAGFAAPVAAAELLAAEAVPFEAWLAARSFCANRMAAAPTRTKAETITAICAPRFRSEAAARPCFEFGFCLIDDDAIL